jgi:reactive intermediate/imine deaminase
MGRTLISSGSEFEQKIGYSRAVVAGSMIFVSGTTGYNYDTMTMSDDVVEQAEQALKNINSALEKAGSSLRDVVRVTYILPDVGDFQSCWPVLQKYLGDTRPAATMICAKLLNDQMKIEIEATAIRNDES